MRYLQYILLGIVLISVFSVLLLGNENSEIIKDNDRLEGLSYSSEWKSIKQYGRTIFWAYSDHYSESNSSKRT